jgi:hypothetical protein
MTYDSWKATEDQPYEELPPAVDPRDEAYTEACEEIDKLERQERERLSCIRLQYKMVLAEYDLAMDCLDRHKADILLGFLIGLSFSLGVLGNTEELPKSRYASDR